MHTRPKSVLTLTIFYFVGLSNAMFNNSEQYSYNIIFEWAQCRNLMGLEIVHDLQTLCSQDLPYLATCLFKKLEKYL